MKKFFLIFILIFLSFNAQAIEEIDRSAFIDDEKKLKICETVLGEHYFDKDCYPIKLKYLWGERLPEVLSKVDFVAELVTKAALSGKWQDYKKLEPYFNYPLKFGIKDDRDNIGLTRQETKYYSYIAYNFQDFIRYFALTTVKNPDILEYIEDSLFSQIFSADGSVDLIHYGYNVYLDIECEGIEKIKDKEKFRLPEDRKYCSNLNIKISLISAYFG